MVIVLALAAGCSCGGPGHEVRWPASPEGVSLARELAATAREEGRRALSPRGLAIATGDAPPEDLPADAAGIRARSLVFDGIWAAEIELGDVPPGSELPLVVIFHGRGDRPRIPGGPFGRVPTPMRVLVPRGPLALGRGFAWARSSVTQGRHDELAADLRAITDRLARMIEHVRTTRPTVGSPIVTGFSQGAFVAWTLAVRHPERVGLAIPIAGWVLPANRPSPLRAPPIRAMHGTADPIVRIEPTRAWIDALRAAGADVTWLELEGVEHVVTPEMNAQLEDWLEQALRERAPDLGGGLGEAGPDPEPLVPYDPPAEDVDVDAEAVPAPLPEEAVDLDEAPPSEGEASDDESAPDARGPPAGGEDDEEPPGSPPGEDAEDEPSE